MANFDGTDAFFDSCDVIERIAELEAQATNDDGDLDFDTLLDSGENEEYQALTALQKEAEGYISDWQYGETFYTWDALVEYTEELVNECYGARELPSWVTNHIDWEKVTK